MKVNVQRQLSGGNFAVAFTVGDFAPDELQKMASFGVPQIKLQWVVQGNRHAGLIALNNIGLQFKATFTSEKEAREYEAFVLEQIRTAMQALRERKDDFSSSSEVAI
jgi:hypothetical protein